MTSSSLQTFLSLPEVSHKVSSLRLFTPKDVGTPEWREQHHSLEVLNIQAHADATAFREEIVKEAFIENDKISLLVADLLISEAWMQHALPDLRTHLAVHTNSLASYALVQHQGVVANLLEIILHHPDAAAALSEEAAIELCDWCTRQVAFLDGEGRRVSQCQPLSAKEILEQSPEDELRERVLESYFGCGLASVTILRHLTDHAASNTLSLGVQHRIAATNGIAIAVVPLVVRPPWERPFHGNGGGKQRWERGEWVPVPPAELHRLGTTEAQLWLLLCNLLLDPTAAAKLDLENERVVESLLQLRSKITPNGTQQLPLLEGLQRFLEALVMGAARQWHGAELQNAEKTVKAVIEQPPKLRTALLKGVDWSALIKRQREQQFAPGSSASSVNKDIFARIIDNIDFLCDMYMDESEQRDRPGQLKAPRVKLDAYCDAGKGQWRWHASYQFHLELDTPPEAIKVEVPCEERMGGALIRALSPEEGSVPATVSGSRYRLEMPSESRGRAFASEMKVVVGFGDKACEAMVSLPASPTR